MPMFRYYLTLLRRHPYLVQSVQAGCVMATGDFIAQIALEQHKIEEYDYNRTAEIALLGTFVLAPIVVTWLRMLHRLVPPGPPQSGPPCTRKKEKLSIIIGLKKMIIDQVFFAPFGVALFLVSMNLLRGKDMEHIKKEFEHKYFEILKTNYKVWPVVQLINFTIMPLNYQLLFGQIVAIFWNVYLSWKSQENVE